jgi:hypothetical protein
MGHPESCQSTSINIEIAFIPSMLDLVEVTKSNPLNICRRFKINKLLEENIFKGVICGSTDHGDFERVHVAFGFDCGRKREWTSINV